MKTTYLSLPVIAVISAIAGVFATEIRVPASDIAVTASPVFCALDGFCDQSHAATCKIASTGTVFYRIQGITCAVAATGKFHN